MLDTNTLSSLPLDVPLKPMNPRRKKCSHTVIAKGHANDDEVCVLISPVISANIETPDGF